MRTFDRNFLINNPPGDEKAKSTLTSPIPEEFGVPLNPDGSRPEVTIDVEGPTWMNAITALGALENFSAHDQVLRWIESTSTVEEIEAANATESDDEFSDMLLALADRIFPEPQRFDMGMSLIVEDGRAYTVQFVVHAPSVVIASLALQSKARKSMLMNIAIALCPERDDDDDDHDSDDVVVVL